MAKLKHISMTAENLNKTAKLYEKVFGMERLSERPGRAVRLSDGVVNLTLLKFPSDEEAGDERGKDFYGWHHFGFAVDDIEKSSATIIKNGGTPDGERPNDFNVERKFRDPDGLVVDIAKGWEGAP